MIKINTGKGKLLSFDIDIEGGNSNEIKEGRFIISCPNKNYKLMFNAIIENNNIVVDLPPLDINETSGKCSLEMISNDNQYYDIWNDVIKFNKDLTIKVKEQKNISDKKLNVILNEEKKEKKIIRNSENINLYRTIKTDAKTIDKIISENKFSMKPKENINVKFYRNDKMLINDMENIDFGICIGMPICTNGIIEENKDQTLIVDSSYLENISEKNVIFLIKEGKLIKLGNQEL